MSDLPRTVEVCERRRAVRVGSRRASGARRGGAATDRADPCAGGLSTLSGHAGVEDGGCPPRRAFEVPRARAQLNPACTHLPRVNKIGRVWYLVCLQPPELVAAGRGEGRPLGTLGELWPCRLCRRLALGVHRPPGVLRVIRGLVTLLRWQRTVRSAHRRGSVDVSFSFFQMAV